MALTLIVATILTLRVTKLQTMKKLPSFRPKNGSIRTLAESKSFGQLTLLGPRPITLSKQTLNFLVTDSFH
jgi:hypothetical protein